MAAAVEWDRRGAPDRPGAWLTTTAWRKALDRLRHERVAAAHAPELVDRDMSYDFELFDESSLQDDQLKLLFTCCHPCARARGADGPDPAQRRGAHRARDRARVPVERERDGAPADASPQQGLRCADPVPRADRRPAGGTARGRAAGRLPRLQRGPRAAPRAARGGDPAGPAAGAPDARRGRGPWPAGPVPAHRRALGGACGRRAARLARRAGPWPLGSRFDHRGRGGPRARAAAPARRLLRDPGRDRRRARGGAGVRRRPTGRRSPASTSSCCATTRRRWSRSTAPSRSASPRVREAGLAAPARRSAPRALRPASTPPATSSYAARATRTRPPPRSTPRSPSRPTRPNATRSAT